MLICLLLLGQILRMAPYAKFNDVSQLLLDLQTLVLVAAPVLKKALAFVDFPSS